MLTVLLPENDRSAALRRLLEPLLPAGSDIRDPDAGLDGLHSRRLLFAVALDEGGCNMAYYRMLSRLRRSSDLLEGCTAGCIVTGVGEFYTKDVARWEAWSASTFRMGAGFSHASSRAISSASAAWKAVTSSVPPICAWVRKLRREPVASTSGRPMKPQPA